MAKQTFEIEVSGKVNISNQFEVGNYEVVVNNAVLEKAGVNSLNVSPFVYCQTDKGEVRVRVFLANNVKVASKKHKFTEGSKITVQAVKNGNWINFQYLIS